MTRVYLWAGSLAAVLALLAGIWLHGRSAGAGAERAARDRDSLNTIERYQDAQDRAGAGGAHWTDRLRQAGD